MFTWLRENVYMGGKECLHGVVKNVYMGGKECLHGAVTNVYMGR